MQVAWELNFEVGRLFSGYSFGAVAKRVTGAEWTTYHNARDWQELTAINKPLIINTQHTK
jgi:hypothetical protein